MKYDYKVTMYSTAIVCVFLIIFIAGFVAGNFFKLEKQDTKEISTAQIAHEKLVTKIVENFIAQEAASVPRKFSWEAKD